MIDPSDTGLSTERTSLAWQRTALAHLAAGMILVRAVVHDPGWLLGFVLVIVFVGVGVAWFAALSTTLMVRRRASLVLTICAVLLAATSAAVVLVQD